MTQRVRQNVKAQIDEAIAAGTQPKAPRNGLGLALPSGARFRTLFDKKGLTAVGKYYIYPVFSEIIFPFISP